MIQVALERICRKARPLLLVGGEHQSIIAQYAMAQQQRRPVEDDQVYVVSVQ